MNAEERALIDGLFDRMRAVADVPRDAEAEALIAQRVAQAPHAPYALTQTVLVQEHALQAANARIEELEAQLRARPEPAPQGSGSFLGGLTGARTTSVPPAGQRPAGGSFDYPAGQQGGQLQGGPVPGQPAMPARSALGGGFGGGGFLSSALTTAAGVAGGALLYDGIRSMIGGSGSPFGAGEAKASDTAAGEAKADSSANDASGSGEGSSWSPWGDSKADADKTAADNTDADKTGTGGADTAADSPADAGQDPDGFFGNDLASDETGFDGGLDGGFDDSGWA